jgi:hypothetical protein
VHGFDDAPPLTARELADEPEGALHFADGPAEPAAAVPTVCLDLSSGEFFIIEE